MAMNRINLRRREMRCGSFSILALSISFLLLFGCRMMQKKRVPNEIITNCIGMQFKLIPAGSFMMGSSESEKDRGYDESPRHKVTLTKPFYLGICEVTRGQYGRMMGPGGDGWGARLPAVDVRWEDAQDFCRDLSKLQKNMTFRLPTEAEWEYACRAGTKTAYYWGNAFDEQYAWGEENSRGKIREVGTRLPNAWGLYDMSGNAWEWCEDCEAVYPSGRQVDPVCESPNITRVIRGGSWRSRYNEPQSCRSANRSDARPRALDNNIGFRVVAVPVAGQ